MLRLSKKGIMLVSVLILSVLLVMLTVSMVFISSEHLNLLGNVEHKANALNAAEAGIEYALVKLNEDTEWGSDTSDSASGTLDGNSSFYITFDTGQKVLFL